MLISLKGDSTSDEMEINMETLHLLEVIPGPISSIAIVGAQRSGKSYFLNKLAKEKDIFKTSNSYKPCTKGIWVWAKFDVTSKQSVILFDTEGLFDPKTKNQQIGSKLCAVMSLVTSNILIYLKGKIDQDIPRTLQYPLIFGSSSKSWKRGDNLYWR